MVVPEELPNPVIVPPVGVVMMAAVQVKIVPLTDELNATLVAVALQIVCGEAEPNGLGFTVTSTVKDTPVHPLAVGVIKYVTTPPVVPVLVNV